MEDSPRIPEGWHASNPDWQTFTMWRMTAIGRQLIWYQNGKYQFPSSPNRDTPEEAVADADAELSAELRRRSSATVRQAPKTPDRHRQHSQQGAPDAPANGLRTYWAVYTASDGTTVAEPIRDQETLMDAAHTFESSRRQAGNPMVMAEKRYYEMREYFRSKYPNFKEA